ncbi:hypothetical protein CR513_01912, partial [Mucuna pruriens]
MIVCFEHLYGTADNLNIQIYSENIFRDILAGQSTHNGQLNVIQCNKLVESIYMNSSYDILGNIVHSFKIEGSYSGVCPCDGSLPCIWYSVSLAVEGENVKQVVEVCNEFVFEVGVGAVVSYIEEVVIRCLLASMLISLPTYSVSQNAVLVIIYAFSQPPTPWFILLLNLLRKERSRLFRLFSSPHGIYSATNSRVHATTFVYKIFLSLVNLHCEFDFTLLSQIDFGCGSGCLLEA